VTTPPAVLRPWEGLNFPDVQSRKVDEFLPPPSNLQMLRCITSAQLKLNVAEADEHRMADGAASTLRMWQERMPFGPRKRRHEGRGGG
jgi:hypothetical protein